LTLNRMNTSVSSVDILGVGLNDFTRKRGFAGTDAEICDGIDRPCASVVRVVGVLSARTEHADPIPVGCGVFMGNIIAFGVVTASNFRLRITAEFYELVNLPHFPLVSKAYARRPRIRLFASALCTSF